MPTASPAPESPDHKTLVKTRFAPSPTGLLHLGNVRTALFSALWARKHDGVFLLRIEDTDRERSSDEHCTHLEEDLRWLGLDWQEGPGAGGDQGPYFQSRRQSIYDAYYTRLIEAGLAYPCFCGAKQLELSRKAQLAAGRPPRYPGTCSRLSPEEVARKREEGLPASLRFRVPLGKTVEFEDLVRGPQRFETDHIGDFIIRRSDGTPAFFFTNAVDDALMAVTHVLRGEDHVANTPRQLLLLEALGLDAPRYGHISLIVGADGGPLSKREGSGSVRGLREQGFLPLAIDNHLARLGHAYEADGFMDFDALAEGFELNRLGKAPARHDEAQLRHWQKEALVRLDDQALWAWMLEHRSGEGGRIEGFVPEGEEIVFVQAVRDNVEMPADALHWATQFFSDQVLPSAEAREVIVAAGEAFFHAALDALPEAADDFKAYAKAVGTATGTKGKGLFMPLRAALTGETHGPEMGRVFPLIGVDRARARLRDAAAC